MNRKSASTLTATAAFGTATLLAAGLLYTSASAADSDLVKREEDRVDLVLVDDRDDDDTNDDTSTGGNTGADSGTGNSNDATNSRFTGVSRDRDSSRGDKTRDWTRDGAGGDKRDWSGNKTNDRSRNDTRG